MANKKISVLYGEAVVGDKTYKAGEPFDLPEKEADSLIERGIAQEVKPSGEPKPDQPVPAGLASSDPENPDKAVVKQPQHEGVQELPRDSEATVTITQPDPDALNVRTTVAQRNATQRNK